MEILENFKSFRRYFVSLQKSLDYHELGQEFFDPRVIEILEKIGYKKNFYSSDFNKRKRI